MQSLRKGDSEGPLPASASGALRTVRAGSQGCCFAHCRLGALRSTPVSALPAGTWLGGRQGVFAE